MYVYGCVLLCQCASIFIRKCRICDNVCLHSQNLVFSGDFTMHSSSVSASRCDCANDHLLLPRDRYDLRIRYIPVNFLEKFDQDRTTLFYFYRQVPNRTTLHCYWLSSTGRVDGLDLEGC